jgi:hypothetical protein
MERRSERRAPAERGTKEGHVNRKTALAFAICLLTALAATLRAGAESAPGQPPGSRKGKMPGRLLLGSIAQQYRPVEFDHAKHVGIAGSCAECHHQHDGGRDLTCSGCHRIDAAAFRKDVNLARIRPCGECHPASYRPENPGRPTLSAAYHRACIKCHREVGSVGRDPKGCVELCHQTNAQAMAR